MISVIVRSHNDEMYIRRTLTALTTQRLSDEFEILNFDDNSSDATPAIVREFPSVRVIPWDGLPYNPARVLNRAVREARGDIILFNNSDAIPLDEHCLEQLAMPLKDRAVGAVYGNQLPRPDALPLVRKDNLRAFGDGSIAATWRFMFSLVLSGARREVLTANPFLEEFQYSEDIEWAMRLRKRGLHIVYVPGARVEHSHNYTHDELRKRFYSEGRANGMLFRENPSFLRFAGATLREMIRDVQFLHSEHRMDALFSGISYRLIQRYSAYSGERDYCKEIGR